MPDMSEPTCCGEPMVHNSGTGQYECAVTFFALPAPADRERYDHWLNSRRPDA